MIVVVESRRYFMFETFMSKVIRKAKIESGVSIETRLCNTATPPV
jgi:hypothetical protein